MFFLSAGKQKARAAQRLARAASYKPKAKKRVRDCFLMEICAGGGKVFLHIKQLKYRIELLFFCILPDLPAKRVCRKRGKGGAV